MPEAAPVIIATFPRSDGTRSRCVSQSYIPVDGAVGGGRHGLTSYMGSAISCAPRESGTKTRCERADARNREWRGLVDEPWSPPSNASSSASATCGRRDPLPLRLDDLLAERWGTGTRSSGQCFMECHAEYRTDGPVELAPVGERRGLPPGRSAAEGLISRHRSVMRSAASNLERYPRRAHRRRGRALPRYPRRAVARRARRRLMIAGRSACRALEDPGSAPASRGSGRVADYDTWHYTTRTASSSRSRRPFRTPSCPRPLRTPDRRRPLRRSARRGVRGVAARHRRDRALVRTFVASWRDAMPTTASDEHGRAAAYLRRVRGRARQEHPPQIDISAGRPVHFDRTAPDAPTLIWCRVLPAYARHDSFRR